MRREERRAVLLPGLGCRVRSAAQFPARFSARTDTTALDGEEANQTYAGPSTPLRASRVPGIARLHGFASFSGSYRPSLTRSNLARCFARFTMLPFFS